MTKSATDIAIEYACNTCFHRSLTLPEDSKHSGLRVTFATTTNFDTDTKNELPTMLYCQLLAGPRYMVYDLNHVAYKAGVKMIFVDRPGFGGSTPVPLEQRVDVWLTTIPLLLAHLGVKHVSLISHSAGTIYLLNTLLRLPEILDPIWPYAALQAPWVHPTHSNTTLMSATSHLPESWIGSFGGVQSFIGAQIGLSSGILDSAASMFGNISGGGSGGGVSESEEGAKIKEIYGFEEKVWKEIESLRMSYFRSEDISGIGQEALQCLKKKGSDWGSCADLPTFIDALVEQLKKQQGPCFRVAERQKLKIKVLFSESDLLIGKGGQAYFKKCWDRNDVREVLDFESATVRDTNHDSIVSPQKEGVGMILREFENMPRDF